jgi:hypothetical protein
MASTPAEASDTMRESGCPFSNERMPSLTCSLSSATRIRFEPLYLYFRGCGRGLKILRRSRLSVFSFQIGNRGRGAVRFSRSTHPRCTHNTHSPVGRPDCPAHWNGASWRSVWRPTELKSREFVQAKAMSDNDLPTTTEAVHRLKQEIDCLAEEQRKALKLAIYVGMTTAEAKEHDQRWTRISELVQQLRILEKASDECANKRICGTSFAVVQADSLSKLLSEHAALIAETARLIRQLRETNAMGWVVKPSESGRQ